MTNTIYSATLQLTEQLIALRSPTPQDGGCQDLLKTRLAPLGFALETIESGPPDQRVTNLWASRPGRAQGAAARTLVFAGHTDVVPAGPLEAWTFDPFTPTRHEGRLYGRGASDMKTSIAAFVVAAERFITGRPDCALSVALLLTSDEEGPATDGTVVVCERLAARGVRLDWCVVGEPTCVARTGDMIKNGRRGSLSGRLTVHGVQGHIAYPQLAKNPVHLAAPAIAELAATQWDDGNRFFQPTGWQISNFHAGTGASNVIPGRATIDFNFRFSTESDPASLQKRVRDVLDRHALDYEIAWTLGGQPFLTTPGDLVDAMRAAIRTETGREPELSTSGGTSDGRFIARICPQTIEFGPPNATIHKIDEHIVLADIEPLTNIYRRLLENLDALVAAPAP